MWFPPEHHVFPNAEPVDQFEVLVHQTDVAVSDHGPAGRFEFSGGDRCKRRLSGAVLTAERVDLAGKNVEIDSRDGVDAAGVHFVDASQLERRSAPRGVRLAPGSLRV